MDMAGGDSVQLATIGSAIKITMEAQIDKNKPTGSFSMYVEIMGVQLHVVTAPSFGEETDATGLARKVFNQINSVDSSLRTQRANLATHEADIIRLNKKLGAPFEYQQEMAEKYGELKRLEAELQGEGEKVAVPPSAGKKQGQEQDNPIQQSALSGALPGERQLARYDYQDVMARESGALPGESRFNQASGRAASTADRAVYDMAQEGKSAAEILEFIGKASRRPFNRYLANALKNLGASSTITLDSQGGWRFGNTSRAQKYAAAYNSRTDTVALSTAREAERHILHELVHAATMKAIKAGWPAAVRMRALFKHVQKSGKVNGQYGMSNLDEFVAEAFTNPKFQEALKGVPAPAGSTLKSAWQWFVNIVARVLGFKTSVAKTALDRAMTIGAQLMRENAAGMTATREDTRYAIAWHGTPHVWGPEPGFPHGRPRLDKIGTGEGAQAYGWGWYSADSRSVADSYHKQLSAAASLGLRRWRYLTDGMSQKEAMVVDQMNAAARAYVPKGEPPLSFRNYLDFYNAKARVRELDLAFYAKNKDRIDANTAKLEAFKQANPEGYKDLMGDEPPDWAARPYAAAYAQAEKVINEYVSGLVCSPL
jgi:hypothetical protein